MFGVYVATPVLEITEAVPLLAFVTIDQVKVSPSASVPTKFIVLAVL